MLIQQHSSSTLLKGTSSVATSTIEDGIENGSLDGK
jgi:hypothetical protein